MDQGYGAGYGRLYSEHWWWRSREAILVRLLDDLRLPPDPEILDFGCGDGLFLPRLARFGRVRGIEADETLLTPDGPYRDRISTRPLGDPSYLGPKWRFDLITALDVIEHIDDDGAAVASLAAMLRPGGLLLVTVPAFPLLWDEHDRINQHYRRYTARSLARVLEGRGLDPIRVRYLFPGLFLPKLLVRLLNAGRRRKVAQHAVPPRPLNALMQGLCAAEERLLGRLPVPFGTSVLALARRKASGSARPAPRAGRTTASSAGAGM